ncbi:GNAT family N-acetyltransferase [Ottowia testudinis]|uniref:N-acetyltransferase n=1 Tax=Ottowia testudinis TaxID=2816950 RepID=A0A975H2E8_9BURK|nr:GNAT family N-acetyltransferase [Ottowia testudinis]QTD44793.1 N-acetyltransferase [Ottowia testudinis]
MTPSESPSITLNEAAHRFELSVDGHTAHVEFARLPDGIATLHTVVPKALEGRGIGSKLVRHVLDYAAAHQLKVRPDCSFVKSYIDRHPEYQAISLAHE